MLLPPVAENQQTKVLKIKNNSTQTERCCRYGLKCETDELVELLVSFCLADVEEELQLVLITRKPPPVVMLGQQGRQTGWRWPGIPLNISFISRDPSYFSVQLETKGSITEIRSRTNPGRCCD